LFDTIGFQEILELIEKMSQAVLDSISKVTRALKNAEKNLYLSPDWCVLYWRLKDLQNSLLCISEGKKILTTLDVLLKQVEDLLQENPISLEISGIPRIFTVCHKTRTFGFDCKFTNVVNTAREIAYRQKDQSNAHMQHFIGLKKILSEVAWLQQRTKITADEMKTHIGLLKPYLQQDNT
jgi:predicted DNA-binding protein YlxM (UPF0122 family)